MNHKELKELIDFLIERDISEFELQRGDEKVRIKRGAPASASPAAPFVATFSHPPQASPQAAHAFGGSSSPSPPQEAARAAEELHIVKSPIVGTFYEAPAPGAPPFVKIGDSVEAGQVLCIIEAMKLMNEIETDIAGEIVQKLVANNQAVEYGQPLFAIRPRK
ncbi:MAG TPA: acetyl-CoA carboxylase biotin carboxyl carrier protein [Candidatus Angelobacter sp.]|jgi:acetyl-CoA carboxylase biotin carboxyl carrier protein|nr:acetyl-CoA carboxylase biotin carboxyl carrier protein [Candidatus Angelobacter sp.]